MLFSFQGSRARSGRTPMDRLPGRGTREDSTSHGIVKRPTTPQRQAERRAAQSIAPGGYHLPSDDARAPGGTEVRWR